MSWKGAALFYHQVGVILRTDLSVSQAVAMAGPVAAGFHANHARTWAAGCEAGQKFWQQLEASGEDPLAVALVRAGENSGRLPELCDRLGVHYEHLDKLLWNFIGKAIYPVILLHAALITPNVPAVFLGTKPAIALLYGPLALWTLIAIGVIVAYSIRKSGMLARIMLMPGPILFARPLLTAMTCEVVGAAFAAGMLAPDALEMAAGAIPNRVWTAKMRDIAEESRRGRINSVGQALATLGFANDHAQILTSAETAGRIDQALTQVATIAEEAFRLRTEWGVRILNGILYAIAVIVVAGVVIGGMSQYVQAINDASKDTP